MMSDDDSIEQFKEAYGCLSIHQQDLATRWLDLGSNTLLYRYNIVVCDLLEVLCIRKD